MASCRDGKILSSSGVDWNAHSLVLRALSDVLASKPEHGDTPEE
jgi:hypothetical protein